MEETWKLKPDRFPAMLQETASVQDVDVFARALCAHMWGVGRVYGHCAAR